MVTIHDIEIKI